MRILCDRFYRFHRLLRHHRHFRNFFLRLFLLCCGSRLIGAAHGYQNIINGFLRLLHRYVCCPVFKERHIILRLHNLRFCLCRMDAGNDLPHALCQLFLQLLCVKGYIRSCCSVLLLQSFFHCICGHHSRRSAGSVSPGLILYRFQNFLLCGCRMLAYCLGKLLLSLGNNIFRDRVCLVGRHFIYNDLFQLRNGCLHPFLNGHHFISVVVNRLLHRCQVSQGTFQLQSFDHILALTEPENQVITALDTFLFFPCLIVKFGKLISPLLRILCFLIFLQNGNLIFQRRTSSLIDLIFKNIPGSIVGCGVYKLAVILHSLIKFLHLDGDFRQAEQNRSRRLRSPVCTKKNFLAVL